MAHRVLVVDDEENLRVVLETLLKKHGYHVHVAESAEAALQALPQYDPDFVLADVRMPGMSGIELCATLKERGSHATVIVMSAYGTVDLAIEAMKAGAYDYVSKPFKQDEVLLVLRKAAERELLRQENRALRRASRELHRFDDMLGKSPVMQRLFDTVGKAAGHTSTVLIQGESGSGKGLVAHALHRLSERSSQPFLTLACASIPESLLESELFGHREGAFTDATSDKKGLFERAHQGTLFLDEVGDLSPELQGKFLRVLQEGTVRPLGATSDTPVDVRVLASTVRDLRSEVEHGRFREDLFYRLHVVSVAVPPLRAREGDVPLLVEHFLAQLTDRLGLAKLTVAPETMRLLTDYAWPGNVRQLENVLERAAVLSETQTLSPHDFPDVQRRSLPPPGFGDDELSIKKLSRDLEERLIRRALEKTGGNRTAAAKLLEISHRALLYKIKDYGITR